MEVMAVQGSDKVMVVEEVKSCILYGIVRFNTDAWIYLLDVLARQSITR